MKLVDECYHSTVEAMLFAARPGRAHIGRTTAPIGWLMDCEMFLSRTPTLPQHITSVVLAAICLPSHDTKEALLIRNHFNQHYMWHLPFNITALFRAAQ